MVGLDERRSESKKRGLEMCQIGRPREARFNGSLF